MSDIIGISCSIFKKEIECLLKKKEINIPFTFTDSHYHIFPEKLEKELEKCVKPNQRTTHKPRKISK